MPRVLSLLDNDKSTLLVPEAKPRDTNNMLFYHFYVAYVLESLSNIEITLGRHRIIRELVYEGEVV